MAMGRSRNPDSAAPLLFLLSITVALILPVEARIIPVMRRPPPPGPHLPLAPLACRPNQVTYDVPEKVCNKFTCQIVQTKRCGPMKPVNSQFSPLPPQYILPAPNPVRPQVALVQPQVASFQPPGVPAQPLTRPQGSGIPVFGEVTQEVGKAPQTGGVTQPPAAIWASGVGQNKSDSITATSNLVVNTGTVTTPPPAASNQVLNTGNAPTASPTASNQILNKGIVVPTPGSATKLKNPDQNLGKVEQTTQQTSNSKNPKQNDVATPKQSDVDYEDDDTDVSTGNQPATDLDNEEDNTDGVTSANPAASNSKNREPNSNNVKTATLSTSNQARGKPTLGKITPPSRLTSNPNAATPTSNREQIRRKIKSRITESSIPDPDLGDEVETSSSGASNPDKDENSSQAASNSDPDTGVEDEPSSPVASNREADDSDENSSPAVSNRETEDSDENSSPAASTRDNKDNCQTVFELQCNEHRVPKCQVSPIIKCDSQTGQGADIEKNLKGPKPAKHLVDIEMVLRNPTTPSTASPARESGWFATTPATANPQVSSGGEQYAERSRFGSTTPKSASQVKYSADKPNLMLDQTAYASRSNIPDSPTPIPTYGPNTKGTGAKLDNQANYKPSSIQHKDIVPMPSSSRALDNNYPTDGRPNKPVQEQDAYAPRSTGPADSKRDQTYRESAVTTNPHPVPEHNAYASRANGLTPRPGSNIPANGARPIADRNGPSQDPNGRASNTGSIPYNAKPNKETTPNYASGPKDRDSVDGPGYGEKASTSSFKDLLSKPNNLAGQGQGPPSRANIPDCLYDMSDYYCTDSKETVCRKEDAPVCGIKTFETCTVAVSNQTSEICHTVIDKICRMSSGSAGGGVPILKNNNDWQNPSSLQNYGSNELDEEKDSGRPYQSRTLRSADKYPTDTRRMTSCVQKPVKVCSIRNEIVLKSGKKASCVSVPSLRCTDVSTGPFSQKMESCSIYQRQLCNEFPVMEPVPVAKEACENVNVQECFDEIYDKDTKLVSKTLKPSLDKVVCEDTSTRICGTQHAVELILDECTEEERTSCDSGYSERCALVTKRTCKSKSSGTPFVCVAV